MIQWWGSMELVVFDLDGTLLDANSSVSEHTAETLRRMRARNVAYTVATGRTFHSARLVLDGHGFDLPHIYKNGVLIWQPQSAIYSHRRLLDPVELGEILAVYEGLDVSPFVFTLDGQDQHAIYHPPLKNAAEQRLAKLVSREGGLALLPLDELGAHQKVMNVSSIGSKESIGRLQVFVDNQPTLVCFSGSAIEGDSLQWLDIHHTQASKGAAITMLKEELGATRVICFGDSDNDLSMFDIADESFVPASADAAIRRLATAELGHHNDNGVSEYLRERYQL